LAAAYQDALDAQVQAQAQAARALGEPRVVSSIKALAAFQMTPALQSVGENGSPGKAEISEQLRRIAASQGFRNSDPIRQVLLFLGKQAVEYPGQSAKEHQIATSALGRSADFDPRIDSTVRVVVTRLRSRLAEYYTHEGVHDPIQVDIPKGAYLLSFHYRQVDAVAAPTESLSTFPSPAPSAKAWNSRRWLAGIAVVVVVAITAFFAGRRSAAPSRPAPLLTFWDGFLRSGDPLIVFSNPIFEGSPETGMRLLAPSAFHTEDTNDTFTGTGEVMAVHALTEELAALGHTTRVKRSRLFTWDEALANNVIIIGGPAQSSVFVQLPQLQFLHLKPPEQAPYPGEEAVQNVAPGTARENSYYLPSRRAEQGVEYAVVALTPGASSEHSILITAGTNTFATQAAASFLCKPALVTRLLDRLRAKSGQTSTYFEALLKVEIRGGTPIEPELMLLYPR
jgi:hypothetical protein